MRHIWAQLVVWLVLMWGCSEDMSTAQPWRTEGDASRLFDADRAPDGAPRDAAAPVDATRPDASAMVCPHIEANVCRVQSAEGFGECGQPLGAVFTGRECVPVPGCACTGEQCPEFDTAEQCAQACASADVCRQDEAFDENRPSVDLLDCERDLCPIAVAFCSDAKDNPSSLIERAAPALRPITCQRVASPGNPCYLTDDCTPDQWCCWYEPSQSSISSLQGLHACRASLLPQTRYVGCLHGE